jgi:ParB family chromosome partitioning protein
MAISEPDDQADTGEDTALPDFLTEDGEDEDTDDEDEFQHAVAAE